jgi:hypothetical protein
VYILDKADPPNWSVSHAENLLCRTTFWQMLTHLDGKIRAISWNKVNPKVGNTFIIFNLTVFSQMLQVHVSPLQLRRSPIIS